MTERDYRTRETGEQRTGMPSHTAKLAGEDDRSLSMCVVEAVAEALETEPRDFRPLSEVIDPDALDRLFGTSHRPQRGYITFQFEGCDVTISADNWIAISPRSAERE